MGIELILGFMYNLRFIYKVVRSHCDLLLIGECILTVRYDIFLVIISWIVRLERLQNVARINRTITQKIYCLQIEKKVLSRVFSKILRLFLDSIFLSESKRIMVTLLYHIENYSNDIKEDRIKWYSLIKASINCLA